MGGRQFWRKEASRTSCIIISLNQKGGFRESDSNLPPSVSARGGGIKRRGGKKGSDSCCSNRLSRDVPTTPKGFARRGENLTIFFPSPFCTRNSAVHPENTGDRLGRNWPDLHGPEACIVCCLPRARDLTRKKWGGGKKRDKLIPKCLILSDALNHTRRMREEPPVRLRRQFVPPHRETMEKKGRGGEDRRN